MNGRVAKIEAVLTPPPRRHLWQICRRKDETNAEAITRHGIEPDQRDIVIVHRYGGCPTCQTT